MDRRELLVAGLALPAGLVLGSRAHARVHGGTPLAFVTADEEAHVAVIDLGDGSIVGRIRTLPGPRSIEASLLTTAVVAHTALGAVSLVHAPTLRVLGVVRGFRAPRYAAISGPAEQLAYMSDSAAQEVVTLDLGRRRIVWRTRVPGPARHISISPDGSAVWTVLGSKADRIAVLDTADPLRPRLRRTIAAPFRVHDVAFAPIAAERVWVTSGDRGAICLYDIGGRLLRRIEADASPQHVTFDGVFAYVASGDSGTLNVHRASTGERLAAARVPLGSYNVTFGWQRVVTPSLGQGTVALLDPSGEVVSVRRVARAAHDACVVVGV